MASCLHPNSVDREAPAVLVVVEALVDPEVRAVVLVALAVGSLPLRSPPSKLP